jgi:CheY-like chemotaxis protein
MDSTPLPNYFDPPLRGDETILVAEDEPVIRALAQFILQTYGYTVLLAGDGEEAVEVYRRECPRIAMVILDVIMPRLSGFEALRRMAEINPDVYALIVSGFSGQPIDDYDRDRLAGFVPKPYRPQELARAVRSALDRIKQPAPAG